MHNYLVGPSEDEKAFKTRIAAIQKADPYTTFSKWDISLLQKSDGFQKKTIQLYDLAIEFPAFFCNKRLPFWLGGATWIVKEGEHAIPFLQLRREFSKKKSFAFHSLEDIYVHESLHAARAAFEEPKFEEILAYRSSKNRFRRYLGPLFQKPWESTLFILLMSPSILSPRFLFFPFAYLIFLLARLSLNQRHLSRCLRKISKVFKVKNPLWVAIWLTDREIVLFSKSSLAAIDEYVQNQSSFRWQQIRKKANGGDPVFHPFC